MQYCAHPNCSVIVRKGRCPQHERQSDQGTRGTANQRGYTQGWATYSVQFRKQHPLCGERADGTLDTTHSRCAQQGLLTPAQCVDHTVPLTQGGSMWDPSNHMSACHACNAWKMATLETETRMSTEHTIYRDLRQSASPPSQEEFIASQRSWTEEERA